MKLEVGLIVGAWAWGDGEVFEDTIPWAMRGDVGEDFPDFGCGCRDEEGGLEGWHRFAFETSWILGLGLGCLFVVDEICFVELRFRGGEDYGGEVWVGVYSCD